MIYIIIISVCITIYHLLVTAYIKLQPVLSVMIQSANSTEVKCKYCIISYDQGRNQITTVMQKFLGHTVNVERFAGLNFCEVNPIKFLCTNKHSWKTFIVFLKTAKV